MREAIAKIRQKYPFEINAFVLLPDHFHCLWTLPEDDHDFSVKMRLIKTHVTKNYGDRLNINAAISQSRHKRKEKNLWQRRFWEHYIRDEEDYAQHCDYIHYNPVKHRLSSKAQEWQFSSIHRFIAEGTYPPDWGVAETIIKPQDIWNE